MDPGKEVIALMERGGPYTEEEVEKKYNTLPALPSREFMMGSWDGSGVDTGHRTYHTLKDMNWAGKDFRGVDDVDPIVVFDDNGKRVWSEEWGHASVRASPSSYRSPSPEVVG